MKKYFDKKVLQIGLMSFLVIAAGILLYFLMGYLPIIGMFFKRIFIILKPLIYGLVLAYIMHPIVDIFEEKVLYKIEKASLRRNLSILCTFIVIIGIIVALISVIIPQLLVSIQSLIVNIPIYFKNVEETLINWFRDNGDIKTNLVDNYDTITNYFVSSLNNIVMPMADNAMSKLGNGIFGAFTFIFNLVVGLVFAIYILANTKNFGLGLRKILYAFFDTEKVNSFIDEVKHINHVFLQFMIGKICESFGFVMMMTLLFLLIFRYPYALLIAVIIGITDLIPYFGPYIGTIPSTLLICLVDPIKALTFILFIVVLQQIDGNLVAPRIQKQATGLPSFWVLFSITLFGGLFGIIGLLIGVPCFTIIFELVNKFITNRLKKKDFPIEDEFYEKTINIDVIKQKKKGFLKK